MTTIPAVISRWAVLSCFLLYWSVSGYQLVRDYSGNTFFNGWDFYGYLDNLTQGNVVWLNETDAFSQRLAFVNTAGNVVLKVDNTSNVALGQLRNSVRITTQDSYSVSSLWIIDILHLPYGCSIWPAFWSKGALWPEDGEIDIIEGINLMDHNQMALHTVPGCTHPESTDETGSLGEPNCAASAGCVVNELQPNSYAAGFAQAGGGVWAAQFDDAGIFIWFWSRPNVPASIVQSTSTSSIDISGWGVPSASYLSTTCNVTQFFTPQSLVLDITLCGDWAGAPGIYNTTCGNAGTTGNCYNDNVVGPGSKFDEAYFEIKNLRVYTTAPGPTPTPVIMQNRVAA